MPSASPFSLRIHPTHAFSCAHTQRSQLTTQRPNRTAWTGWTRPVGCSTPAATSLQRRSPRPSTPLVLRAAAPTQRAGRVNKRTAYPRCIRIERHAAHRHGSVGRRRKDPRKGGAASMLTMRRLQAPAGHEPGIDQHQHRAFCPAIRETSTYAQMCAAAQPLCGRVETVWVQPQSFDDGRQPESRSSQLTGGPQSIDWGNRVVNIYLRFADSTTVPGSLGLHQLRL